ncbi:50S ribosomal protein L19 [Candidatus Gromoviella agglomerans]|uniref:50S ribosomal protein L19 n=1 Tax=Candidatus Gromoviella agglomerans TaxID=2806609 RepID=UPI001E435266|nr:50S ribosomal protein L19 [Candidatus Gromoviella agglomerans]UFX98513.1 50S ribosomal protein L19 [Candidatus Gromoviella agglomerans]
MTSPLVESFNRMQIQKINESRAKSNISIPEFRPGDLLSVEMKVNESGQLQTFEGRCIAKRNRGLHSSFTLRKVNAGTGVEIVVPIFSPMISNLKVIRTGKVRRAKLYYLRYLSAKKSRIQTREPKKIS